jgi:transcription elongation factor Elf1
LVVKVKGKASTRRPFDFFIENRRKARAERIAKSEAALEYNHVTDCPVCGANSLVVYEDTDYDFDEETDEPINYRRFTHEVECESCTFSLEDAVANASVYEIPGIKDFFMVD